MRVRLEHIALSVIESSEVDSFYLGVLGANVMHHFSLNKELAGQIFGIQREIPVTLVQKDDLFMELFVDPQQHPRDFRHICISMDDRTKLVEKARKKDYECVQIKRNDKELVFIKDKSGNIFEIKG